MIEPNSAPETNAAYRDDDRLATELFRRYGSLEQNRYRTREHWLADAAVIRELVAVDAAFLRIAEELASGPVHINRSDPDERAATWSEGFDEAWRQRDEEERVVVGIAVATALVAAIAGFAIGRWRR